MFNNLRELIATMPDEKTCRDYLISMRWEGGKPICPYCGYSGKCYVIEGGKRFKCGSRECYKKFSVTVGTIFEASNITLMKWLPAIYLCTAHKKGISSYQLARDLGVSQKTGWFMLHRIRELLREKVTIPLEGTLQADETFIGGRNANRHKSKKHVDENGKEMDRKAPVMGLIQTGGQVRTRVVNAVTKKNAIEFVSDNAKNGSVLVTDSNPSYFKIGKKYEHIQINHGQGQYALNGFHTNGMENYWSVLKRGIYGIYHQVSPKHLQRYCDEFAYRFNSRKIKDGDRFKQALKGIEGRLTYIDLVAEPITPDFIPFTETGDDI